MVLGLIVDTMVSNRGPELTFHSKRGVLPALCICKHMNHIDWKDQDTARQAESLSLYYDQPFDVQIRNILE